MEELFPIYDFAEEHFINFKIESEKISQPKGQVSYMYLPSLNVRLP
jgi:hypothetical protein